MRLLSIVAASLLAAPLGSCASLDRFIEDLADSGLIITPDGSPGPAPGPRTDAPGEPLVAAPPPDAPPPVFGDWWYHHPEDMTRTRKPAQGDPCQNVPRFVYDDQSVYVPVNVPGGAHGGPTYRPGGWFSWYAKCLAQRMADAGAPIAVIIRERNCPFPYATGGNPTSPNEVEYLLDAVPRLDYVFMDLEPIGGGTREDVVRNIEEIVRLVRSHPNPAVSDAYIGNYNDWPGEEDPSRIWPKDRDRTAVKGSWDRDALYREHLNVAMPNVYPYEVYSVHCRTSTQKENVSPNPRAAILWGALRRQSEAAAHLPEGDLLIPWVCNYVAHEGGEDYYHAPPPPREDLEAMIRHVRLRGAHSYMIWTANPDQTDHPTISHDEFRALALDSWKTLDPAFSEGETPRVLNLDDDKTSGVIWSGVVGGGRAWVLVSNLGDEPASVELPSIPGVPARTPGVPPGQHRLYRWRIGN